MCMKALNLWVDWRQYKVKIAGIECEELNGPICRREPKPVISVFCLTYNHVRYIKDCLEGVLMQKTDFLYEIVIFDDASNDGTSDIIRAYCNKYPKVIHAIIAKENIYRKPEKDTIWLELFEKQMRGEFVAFCEGDDYWIDDNKLQKQVEFMIKNPEYTLTLHNGIKIDMSTGEEQKILDEVKDYECRFEDFVYPEKPYPTASMVVRRNNCINIRIFQYGFADWAIKLYSIVKGKAFYFNETMSVYRWRAEGSWSYRTHKNKIEALCHYLDVMRFVKNYEKDTNYIYHDIIKKLIKLKLGSIRKIMNLTEEDFQYMKSRVRIENMPMLEQLEMIRKVYINQGKVMKNHQFQSFINENYKGKKIYIFSASQAGREMYQLLSNLDLDIIGFLDNDERKWESNFETLTVYSPKEVLSYEEECDCLIQVATLDYDEEICEQLQGMDTLYISAEQIYSAIINSTFPSSK